MFLEAYGEALKGLEGVVAVRAKELGLCFEGALMESSETLEISLVPHDVGKAQEAAER